MIENANASKMPAEGEFFDIRKYIGVASINILAVNPDNEKLRKYGWQIPEDADEPKYIITREDASGKTTRSSRISFLVQIQDIEDKPVIALNFFCRPDVMVNKDNTKCKIIDEYGRTAWATKDDIKGRRIPVYKDGNPANISTPYRMCHFGEEELVSFLFKYLNITPLQIFDKARNQWTPTKNPGRLTIDNWNAVCDANVREIATYLASQPENRVKVVLGVRTTDENRSYQTFLNTGFIGNGARADINTGEYTTARKLIDKYFENRDQSSYIFDAKPVKEWKVEASEVKESHTMFDDNGNYALSDSTDDLPFE